MLSCDRAKPFVLAAGLALLAGRLVWLYVVPAWQTIITDFPNYYVSAWAVRHGEPLTELYNPLWFEKEKRRAGIERPAALFNYFPPMNALIMWPLAQLPPLTAKRAWTVANVFALIAVIGLTIRASGLKWQPAALVALMGGDALGNNFTYGQFYIVLTLFMLSGVVLSKRYPSIAGVATAAGALTKIFPGFLLVYFAIRREYRALVWCAASLIVLAMLGLITLGWLPHHTYLAEVLGRTLRGEIQDPYNVHWNTLQAFLRRALVGDDLLNPNPILNAPWLYFFLRPLTSLAVVTATLYSLSRTSRRHPLLGYGAVIGMVSLITPSQASYHQFLFYPAIAGLVAIEESWAKKIFAPVLFGMICSNVMGATAGHDSGIAMILAFPRVWLVAVLWVTFLLALDPPAPKISMPLIASAAVLVVVLVAGAFWENRRWIEDVSDGATRVPLASPADLEIQPRFVGDRLVASVLGDDGFSDPWNESEATATSPDGKWTAFATNQRGNWDIAIRSNQTGEVRYLTSSSANDLTPAFSPDGKYVYFASDRHRGYRFTTIYRVSVNAH
ncbi:MAG TPA: glycosyltransferase 87 family protein [Terriglobia bacterium]|nr:glycosyltransferase 87 family protein [Terriglobia bacterium]